MTPEEAARFVEAHRETIARACVLVARRSAFTADEAALFHAWLDRQFAADEYALIRRLRFEQLKPETVLAAIIPVMARRFRGPAPSTSGRHLTATRAVRDQSDVHELSVLAADVVVGSARFTVLSGLAWALLWPTDGYSFIAGAARAIGDRLTGSSYWPAGQGDVASSIAADWAGPPLSLRTSRGESVSAASVVIVDAIHASGRQLGRRVVVDFRSAATPVPAIAEPPVPSDLNAGSRPAA